MSLKESISLLMQKVDGLSAAVAAAIKSVAANSGGSGGGLSLPIGTIISYSALKGETPAGCLALSQTSPTVVNTTEYPELIGMASGIKTSAENAIKSAQNKSDIQAALVRASVEAQAGTKEYLKMIGGGHE